MSAADDILARMRRRKAGWTPDDFRTLYEGFGFDRREGSGHTNYQHPRFPQLWTNVGRHRVLGHGYARDAVRLIDMLNRLKAEEEAKRDSQ